MKKKLIIIFIFLAMISVVYLLTGYKLYEVSGNSMEPNFKNGEDIIISKLAYLLKEPERGDAVLFENEGQMYIKRIIGASSEIVGIKEGKVSINENIMSEDYIKGSYTFGSQNVSLGKEQYFLLGDNREANESVDSRILGPISKSKIIGKVIGKWTGGFEKIKDISYSFGQ